MAGRGPADIWVVLKSCSEHLARMSLGNACSFLKPHIYFYVAVSQHIFSVSMNFLQAVLDGKDLPD